MSGRKVIRKSYTSQSWVSNGYYDRYPLSDQYSYLILFLRHTISFKGVYTVADPIPHNSHEWCGCGHASATWPSCSPIPRAKMNWGMRTHAGLRASAMHCGYRLKTQGAHVRCAGGIGIKQLRTRCANYFPHLRYVLPKEHAPRRILGATGFLNVS